VFVSACHSEPLG
jgi:hypothetical protein